MLHSTQRIHVRRKYRLPAGTTRDTPKEFCRTRHPNLEEPLYRWPGDDRPRFPVAPLGRTGATRRAISQPHARVQNQPKALGMGTTIRNMRLQPNTNCAAWDQSVSARKTRQARKLGQSWQIRLVHRTSMGFLPMLPMLGQRNSIPKNHRHRILVSKETTYAGKIYI